MLAWDKTAKSFIIINSRAILAFKPVINKKGAFFDEKLFVSGKTAKSILIQLWCQNCIILQCSDMLFHMNFRGFIYKEEFYP